MSAVSILPQSLRLAGLGLLWVSFSGPGAALGADDSASAPQPFTAVYAVEWHGIVAGYSTLELKQIEKDAYLYSSNIRASGLFRLAFPDAISESSTFELMDGHVMPIAYSEENGGKAGDRVDLSFDWSGKRVQGTVGSQMVDEKLEKGTEDPLSVQIELMHDLKLGAAPASFLLFDKRTATRYDYTREGTSTLDTALGRLDTVIYRSDRPGSDRVTRLWLAPSLGYIPVQGERRSHGKVDFSLHIRKLDHPT